MLINVIVTKYVIETLIWLLQVEICDMLASMLYFYQILAKREFQIREVFNFAVIQFCDFVILKLFVDRNFTKMVENCKNCKI